MQSPLANWPVRFAVRRSMAETLRILSPAKTTTNEYVDLPNFISLTGTLEEPTVKLDKLALTGSVLERFGDKIPGVDQKTGDLLKGLGGLLGGGNKGSNTNAPANTNQPPPRFNPLDLLKKPKQ